MEILREIKMERDKRRISTLLIKINKNHLSLSPDDVPHLRAIFLQVSDLSTTEDEKSYLVFFSGE